MRNNDVCLDTRFLDNHHASAPFPVMLSSFYPVHWLVFEPNDLVVSGHHFPENLPVHPRIETALRASWPLVRANVLATPGGFDGPCAALLHWKYHAAIGSRPAHLHIATGYRSYSQGKTLKRLLLEDGADTTQGPLLPSTPEQLSPSLQPNAAMSWGSSLTTLVLLPDNQVLTGQRGAHMHINPSVWSCLFTEVLEPSDVRAPSMATLLDRLVREELRPFVGMGSQRFVGLLVLPQSYTWTLVALLDLRHVPQDDVQTALAALQPDNETQAWGLCTLPPLPASKESATRPGLEESTLLGWELARDVVARLTDKATAPC